MNTFTVWRFCRRGKKKTIEAKLDVCGGMAEAVCVLKQTMREGGYKVRVKNFSQVNDYEYETVLINPDNTEYRVIPSVPEDEKAEVWNGDY